jgi:regulator of replication initiation timing
MDDFFAQLTGTANVIAKVLAMAEEIVALRDENNRLRERLAQYETAAQTKRWFSKA